MSLDLQVNPKSRNERITVDEQIGYGTEYFDMVLRWVDILNIRTTDKAEIETKINSVQSPDINQKDKAYLCELVLILNDIQTNYISNFQLSKASFNRETNLLAGRLLFNKLGLTNITYGLEKIDQMYSQEARYRLEKQYQGSEVKTQKLEDNYTNIGIHIIEIENTLKSDFKAKWRGKLLETRTIIRENLPEIALPIHILNREYVEKALLNTMEAGFRTRQTVMGRLKQFGTGLLSKFAILNGDFKPREKNTNR